MFDNAFFGEHQKLLVGLLNSPIGGMVRRSLWIDDMKNKVVCITPNAYHVELPNGKYKFTGYINDQYSEALRNSYRPLWELIHTFDMRFANRYMPALNLGFDSYSSQPDETSSNDTDMSSGQPNTNFGTSANLYIGEDSAGSDIDRDLVKYDLSSLPVSIDVSAATHSMWQFSESSNNNRTARMYRILRDWNEAQATWNVYSTGNSWTTAGCAGAGTDYVNTDLGNYSYSSTETSGEKAYTFTADGRTNIENIAVGTISNYGWLIRMDTESDDRYIHRSSNYGTAGERPKLAITYELKESAAVWFM